MRSRTSTLLALMLVLGCGGPEPEPHEPDGLEVANEHGLTVNSLRLGTYVRTTATLSLRSAPNSTALVIYKMPFNAKVRVISGLHNSLWYEVSYRRAVGYAHGGYLQAALARTVRTLPTANPVVALSFNAAADRGHTASILNTLKQEGAKASFAVTGKWIEQNSDLVARMVNEGHVVINHGYSGRSMTGASTSTTPLTYAQRVSDIAKTETAFRTVAGIRMRPYFRPAWGDYDGSVKRDVSSRGYDYNVMWSFDSYGWKGLSAPEIVQRCVSGLTAGAIYLFHVGGQSQDAAALPDFIRELRTRGYNVGSLSTFYADTELPPLPQLLSFSHGGITRGPKNSKTISLVFTGGFHAEGAPTILDALAVRRMKASFFLTGDFVRLFPALVDRMMREGHYVGPHSDAHLLYADWSDRNKTLVTQQDFTADLLKNIDRILAHGRTPESIKFWIPPYEWYNSEISQWSSALGKTLINYTPGSGSENDWKPDDHPTFVSSADIYQRILTYESTQPYGLKGFLMILHVGSGPQRTDKFHTHFPQLLDALTQRGYRFDRVDGMLGP